MEQEGVPPNVITYTNLLQGYLKQRQYHMIDEITKIMEKKQIRFGVVNYSILIQAYMQNRQINKAEQIFNQIKKEGMIPNKFVFTSMINGYIRNKNLTKALNLFNEIPNTAYDTILFNSLINGLVTVGRFEDASQMVDRMNEYGLTSRLDTILTIISGFIKSGNMKNAIDIFENSKSTIKPDAKIYTAIVSGFAKKKDFEKANYYFNEFYEKFGRKRVTPGINALIFAAHRFENYSLLSEYINMMNEKNIPKDDVTYNTLITSYVAQKKIDEALKCLEELKNINSVSIFSYSPLIRYFSDHNQLPKAMELLNDLLSKGVVPDQQLFTCLLASNHNFGDMNTLEHLLNQIKKYNITYNGVMCHCVIKTCFTSQVDSNTILKIFEDIPSRHKFDKVLCQLIVKALTARSDEVSLNKFQEILENTAPNNNNYSWLFPNKTTN